MPLYDYECPNCPERIEIFMRSKNEPELSCQKCGEAMRRALPLIGGYHIQGNNSASQRPKQAGSFKKGPK